MSPDESIRSTVRGHRAAGIRVDWTARRGCPGSARVRDRRGPVGHHQVHIDHVVHVALVSQSFARTQPEESHLESRAGQISATPIPVRYS